MKFLGYDMWNESHRDAWAVSISTIISTFMLRAQANEFVSFNKITDNYRDMCAGHLYEQNTFKYLVEVPPSALCVILQNAIISNW